MARNLTALLGMLSLVSFIAAQTLVMPATCMTPFPASHESDICDHSWFDSISTCINHACSTSVPSCSTNSYANSTVTFVPKLQYSCQQSDVQGLADSLPAPSMLLENGICNQSPYGFLSFTPTYHNLDVQACVLQLFNESDCAGAASNITLGTEPLTGAVSGQCGFGNGSSVQLTCDFGGGQNISENEAAHDYLDSICRTTAPVTATSLATAPSNSTATSMTGASTTTTTDADRAAATSDISSVVPGISSSPNATTTSAALGPSTTTSRVEPYTSEAGETSVKGSEAAQWALVVAVLARSLMW
ncbi:hypothetical protein MBLNU459_g7858t1 [Dothideomycetes sp. NU459]